MKRFLLLALEAIAPASMAQPTVASHCATQEQIVFSCTTTNAKVISLCSSASLTDIDGYLQYRFGAINKPKLVYPAAKEHPGKYFLSGTQMYSGGGSAFLKFKKGDYTYTVFTGIGRGWEKEGVVINKSGKQIAYLPCKGNSKSKIGSRLFEKVKIPKDPHETEFEIP